MVVLDEPVRGDAFLTTDKEFVLTLDGDVPEVVYSYPVKEDSMVYISTFVVVVSDATNKGAGGQRDAFFGRARGNILRFGQSVMESKVSNFTVTQPTVSINTNNTTKKIEVVVTGRVLESLRWYLKITVRETR
jgi:hypothetical protein